MGVSLAVAALEIGYEVLVLSGPVSVQYPSAAEVIDVVSTDELLAAAIEHFPGCDGAIGAAAPCDYQPRQVATQKLSKTGEPVLLELIETPDVIATLGQSKRPYRPNRPAQWVVGFALETDDRRFRAIVKSQRKCCDLMVSNGPEAIDALDNHVELLDPVGGELIETVRGDKPEVARRILAQIDQRLVRNRAVGVQ